MDESLVAPELRHMVRRYPFKLLEYDFGRPLTRLLIKFMPPTRMKGVTIKALKGPPRLRIYRPAARRTDASLLWIHGGGYVLGAARVNDFSCSDICRTLGMTVVSVDYRLAPKFPFPIPADDCLAAWQWMQQSAASLGINPARVVIGGASAGGGLAAGLVQRIHDAGGTQPIAQWLLAPMLDDRTAARRELDAVDHYVWNNRMNRAAWRLYLDTEPGSETFPPTPPQQGALISRACLRLHRRRQPRPVLRGGSRLRRPPATAGHCRRVRDDHRRPARV